MIDRLRESFGGVGRVVILCGAVLLNFVPLSYACDYTVRDIGFVPVDTPRYTLMVVSAKKHRLDKATTELASRWDLQTLCVDASTMSDDLPRDIQLYQQAQTTGISVWLVDDNRRSLLLKELTDAPAQISLLDVFEKQFSTTHHNQLRAGATRSFAQIVLFDGEPSMIDEARKAAAALKQIEPMLPRPISLPAQVITVPHEARGSERVFLWSLGVDDLDSPESTLVVVYGRGRMAGSALTGASITHAGIVAQLALVGESCECETDRDWLQERVIPFYWDSEQDRIASGMLGFDPGNAQVQSEVKRVIARGKRQNATRNGDTVERIVASYMESQVAGYQPPRLAIPPGTGGVESKVNATVIQGDGWAFDGSERKAESARSEPNQPANATAANDSVTYSPKERLTKTQTTEPETTKRTDSRALVWLVAFAVLFACFAIWQAAKTHSIQPPSG